jgi:hypothetical protein
MTLTLTSGHTASFVSSSNGTSALLFRFTTTTNTPAGAYVKITAINMSGVTLTGANSSNVTNQLTDDNRAGKIPAALGVRELDYYTKIAIDTSVPTITNHSLSGTTLTLTFSKEIYKGTADLTLTMVNTYPLPAVLTKNQYQKWGGAALNPYYDVGTNGVLNNTNRDPDTSEKYILKYEIEPTGTAANTTAARNILTNAGAHKVVIPVVSGAVSRNGTQLTVNLSDAYGYVLPIKGVAYAINYDANLVQDSLNNEIVALTGTSRQVTPTGVNPPYIRIKKDRANYDTNTETGPLPVQTNANTVSLRNRGDEDLVTDWNNLGWGNDVDREALAYWVSIPGNENLILYAPWQPNYDNNTQNEILRNWWARATSTAFGNITIKEELGGGTWVIQNTTRTTVFATQPYTAEFRVDCQTPSATLSYAYRSVTSGVYSGSSYNGNNYTFRYPNGNYPQPSVAIPTNTSTTTDNRGTINTATTPYPTFPLGDDTNNGYLYGIRAEATNGDQTEWAGERAARSIIRFVDIQSAKFWSNLNTEANASGKSLQLWIRGGDDANGGANLTPGFPLSWDAKDYGGARLFTRDNATGVRYWITWEVAARPAYFHFIAGTIRNPASNGSDSDAIIADMRQNGPLDWSWAKNAWALQYSEFPLIPGTSLEFRVGSTVSSPATENFEFYSPLGNHR